MLPPLVHQLPATDESITRSPDGSQAAAVWNLVAAVWQLRCLIAAAVWCFLPDGSQRHQCGVCCAVLAAEADPRCWLLPATHDLGTKMRSAVEQKLRPGSSCAILVDMLLLLVSWWLAACQGCGQDTTCIATGNSALHATEACPTFGLARHNLHCMSRRPVPLLSWPDTICIVTENSALHVMEACPTFGLPLLMVTHKLLTVPLGYLPACGGHDAVQVARFHSCHCKQAYIYIYIYIAAATW